jgi:hypothetical protein
MAIGASGNNNSGVSNGHQTGPIFFTGAVGDRVLNWTGGGVTQDATDADNWSPAGPPQPGDQLMMSSGTMLIKSSTDLAGDTLQLSDAPLSKYTLNMGSDASANVALGHQTFGLQVNGNMAGVQLSEGNGLAGTVDLAVNTSLVVTGSLNFILNLNASGVGSHLTNDGTIGLTRGKLDTDLDGTGTYNLNRYHDGFGNVEVTGAVAPGLTFNLQGDTGNYNAGLTIDHPQTFQGNITVGDNPTSTGGPSADLLTLVGLTADSYDLKDDLLNVYSGDTVLASVHLNTNGEPYTVAQSAGSVGVYIGMDAPSGASILPVHV